MAPGSALPSPLGLLSEAGLTQTGLRSLLGLLRRPRPWLRLRLRLRLLLLAELELGIELRRLALGLAFRRRVRPGLGPPLRSLRSLLRSLRSLQHNPNSGPGVRFSHSEEWKKSSEIFQMTYVRIR